VAKVTKKMLKGIVKECLVEILAEGLGDSEIVVEHADRGQSRMKKKSIFDQMDEAFERKPRASDHTTFNDRVSTAAAAATSDPILQSILTDTAKTTLQEQLQHEQSIPVPPQPGFGPDGGTSLSAGSSAGLDINSLFGEASKNWSELLDRTERKPL